MKKTTWSVGDKVCLVPATGTNDSLVASSRGHAFDCGVGEVTAAFVKGNLVSVEFSKNGSTYTKSEAYVFETPESAKRRRAEEQGAIRLKKFNEKYNRSAA